MAKHWLLNKVEKNRFLLAFMLVASTAGLGVGTAQIAVSLYAVHLHASEVQLGLIAAAQSIGILLMGIPTGILINRFGPLLLFALGSLLAGLWYGLIPAVGQVWFLLGCIVLVSFCMPLRFISLNTVFMSQLNRLGTVKAGWFRGTHMIGFMLLGPLLAVWLSNHLVPSGVFAVIALLFTVPVFLSPLIFSGYEVAGKQAPKLSFQLIGQQLSLFKRDITLRFTSLFELLDSAVMGYFTFFIVVIAIRNYGFSPAVAASLVTLYGGVYMAALFGMGVVVQALGEKRAYQLGFGLVAIALLCLALPLSAFWLWLGSPLLGVGLGTLNVINLSVFARIGQHLGMANVSAVSLTCGPSGSMLGSLIGGWLAHLWGLQAIFFPLCAVFVALVVLVQFKHPFVRAVVPAKEPRIDILTNSYE
ncbi:MFS transporter [Alkanindiges illinoisensis]|uniref:MFS transporter n=1 Tax=Alkanindiges illinoisensis TaxID=197183 RepID=UPI000687A93E|nr:MFS transporter [Alkanindiges illinoisensis]